MEFYIRNNYIKKFLSNFANQNDLKIIKYLTIIGINHLQNNQKNKLSYFDLKNLASEIAKSVPKEEKQLNKELKIIKNELAKLNEKFEDKLKTIPQNTIKSVKETNFPRSVSAPRGYDPRKLTRKAPSTWREGEKNWHSNEERRANSNEPTPYPEWWQTYQQTSSHTPSITLKPNEIAFPKVNPKENQNMITRHHLDDTEAKNIMNEQGIIYFPEKDKRQKKEQIDGKQTQKSQAKKMKTQKSKRKTKDNRDQPTSYFSPNRDLSDKENDESVISEQIDEHKAKSLLAQSREANKGGIIRKQTSDQSNMPLQQDTFGPSQNKTEFLADRRSDKHNKKFEGTKVTHHQIHDQKVKNRSKASRTFLNQTQAEQFKEHNRAESKIKDEVDYHKELSKQYRKMKESMKQYDNYADERSASSSQQSYNKRRSVLAEREDDGALKNRQSPEISRYQSGYDNSKLLESASSAPRSANMQRYSNMLLDRIGEYGLSATKQRKTQNTTKNDEMSYYKSQGGENQGGILEIANSFLNSPLMQHLSNIDSNNSNDSSKSSHSNEDTSKQMIPNRITNFDSKNGSALTKSPNNRYDGGDAFGRPEPHSSHTANHGSHKHKFSDWVGVFKVGNTTKDTSIAKDYETKRHPEHTSKTFYTKDDTSSLTSSAFSNFLNDEMKGFFQKETYELKKTKNSRSGIRPESSVNTSNMSFHGNDANHATGEAPILHSRKITYQHSYDNNKSYNGLPLDNVNIFKNERLSVTRLLNNS